MKDTYLCEWTRSELKSTWGAWSGCVRRDFGKTLLRYLCTKARGTSLWPKFQLWHQSVSASVVNPTAFLSLHTSQCASGDDTCSFATQIPSTNRSLRFTGVGRLCGNQHQVHQVCVLVRYRKRVTPLTAKCLQPVLTDTSCPWNPISSFSRDVSTIPISNYQLDSSRARPAQSENIAIDNPIDSGRMDKEKEGRSYYCSFCVFYPSNFVPLNLTFPKQITWGMLKKKNVGTPRVVSGRRRPHASYAPGAQFLQKFTRFALIAVTSARPRVCKCPPPQIPVSQSPF